VKRLHSTFDRLHWMKLSEIARYWAAKELTRIEWNAKGRGVSFKAPFACDEFTVELPFREGSPVHGERPLEKVASSMDLKPDTWCRQKDKTIVCLKLAKGESKLSMPV
jgi:hypothetical protein